MLRFRLLINCIIFRDYIFSSFLLKQGSIFFLRNRRLKLLGVYWLVVQIVVRRHRWLWTWRSLVNFVDTQLTNNILLERRLDCDSLYCWLLQIRGPVDHHWFNFASHPWNILQYLGISLSGSQHAEVIRTGKLRDWVVKGRGCRFVSRIIYFSFYRFQV